MIKREPGSYSVTCTNRVAERFTLVGPAWNRLLSRKNVSAHSGLGSTGESWGELLSQWGHGAMILELWGISQIASMCSAGNLHPVNTSFICILSAEKCAKYHSVQVACNVITLLTALC